MEKNEITIDGKEYVLKSSIKNTQIATKKNNLSFKIVRTYSAGVFAGYLKERKGQEATVLEARRLWHWQGANSLSDLAVNGTTKPNECKFPVAVSKVELTNVIEVLDVTEKAKKSIDGVKIWTTQQ